MGVADASDDGTVPDDHATVPTDGDAPDTLDAGSDTSTLVDASAADASDAGGSDCAALVVDDDAGFFVEQDGTDTSTCGSRTMPCKTVQQGISRAVTLGRSVVYVASGTYNEALIMGSGLRVEGGLGRRRSSVVADLHGHRKPGRHHHRTGQRERRGDCRHVDHAIDVAAFEAHDQGDGRRGRNSLWRVRARSLDRSHARRRDRRCRRRRERHARQRRRGWGGWGDRMSQWHR